MSIVFRAVGIVRIPRNRFSTALVGGKIREEPVAKSVAVAVGVPMSMAMSLRESHRLVNAIIEAEALNRRVHR